MEEMEDSDNYFLRISGSVNIPIPLEKGYDYAFMGNIGVYGSNERDNFNGTQSITFQARFTDEDVKAFFDFSERGIKPQAKKNPLEYTGFDHLCEGKRWRGIHMEMYEDGILEGSVPYFALLHETKDLRGWRWLLAKILKKNLVSVTLMPRSVVDFMKKEMFKGIDARIIEETYQDIVFDYGL
jgi:hypothetical protein